MGTDEVTTVLRYGTYSDRVALATRIEKEPTSPVPTGGPPMLVATPDELVAAVAGRVFTDERLADGWYVFAVMADCPNCPGSGGHIWNGEPTECPECEGGGMVAFGVGGGRISMSRAERPGDCPEDYPEEALGWVSRTDTVVLVEDWQSYQAQRFAAAIPYEEATDG